MRKKLIKAIAIGALTLGSLLLINYSPIQNKNQITNYDKYGSVIYKKNSSAKKQIYIVGQRHSPAFNLNYMDNSIARAQLEIYRIIENLINSKKIEFLLVEGYNSEKDYYGLLTFDFVKGNLSNDDIKKLKKLDDNSLEKIMLDPSPKGMNAGRLLKLNFPNLDIQGIENQNIYDLSLDLINSFRNEEYLEKKEQLFNIISYLNALRSAHSLIIAASKIEKETELKRIKKEDAVIIIGSDHLKEIVSFLEQNKIKIYPKEMRLEDKIINSSGIDERLYLDERGYGITVIKPKSIK